MADSSQPDFYHPLRHITFCIVSSLRPHHFWTIKSVPPENIRSTGALEAIKKWDYINIIIIKFIYIIINYNIIKTWDG